MEAFKHAASAAAHGAQRLGLLRLLERASAARSGLLHVLTYHRVAEPEAEPHLYPGLISATPAQFARQMRDLARRHRVLSLDEVLDSVRRRRPFPPRAVLITFDDAYTDFLAHAWPILEGERLPATLFVPTAFASEPGRGFWWDRLHHALQRAKTLDPFAEDRGNRPFDRTRLFKRLRERVKALPHHDAMAWVDQLCAEAEVGSSPRCVLQWDDLRTLARAGASLCPHTRNHPLLDRISAEEVREEVSGARRDLEREIGSALPVLAYPSGAYDAAAVRVVEEEGYELAFTTERGVVDLGRDTPLRLPRIPVGRRLSGPALRVQLLAQFARFDRHLASGELR
ncbi:MAG: polysaccharide deacetylase family protein [Deltaproteobacteria bacterium]|nr:polysaccharide deacetylase family protein [Deltaproteobacteria bacterium]MBW2360807.1 polysaccharide deacetylase family protein [Deltaproteobacteria bacterium]